MQTSFLPPPPPPTFNIYHDESGTYVPPPRTGDRWLMHGILFVPENKQTEIFEALQAIRDELNYSSEVHFKKIRGHGVKSTIIKKWLNVYLAFSKHCFYHCLAVDTHSPAFQHDRFSDSYYVYNYFARTAIVGGIAWCFNNQPKIKLRFHSDHKYRPDNDNFMSYVPQSTVDSIQEKRQQKPNVYPEIVLLNQEVILVDSDPQKIVPSSIPSPIMRY